MSTPLLHFNGGGGEKNLERKRAKKESNKLKRLKGFRGIIKE